MQDPPLAVESNDVYSHRSNHEIEATKPATHVIAPIGETRHPLLALVSPTAPVGFAAPESEVVKGGRASDEEAEPEEIGLPEES